jgi:hypothetical protein
VESIADEAHLLALLQVGELVFKGVADGLFDWLGLRPNGVVGRQHDVVLVQLDQFILSPSGHNFYNPHNQLHKPGLRFSQRIPDFGCFGFCCTY